MHNDEVFVTTVLLQFKGDRSKL